MENPLLETIFYYWGKLHFLYVLREGKITLYFPSPELEVYKIPLEEVPFKEYRVNLEELRKYLRFKYKNLESYFTDHKELVEHFRKKFENKRVVIGFTGGKDSVVLALALEKLGIDFIPVYTHIPYFEELLYFLSKHIYRRFDVEVIEIPRETVKDILSKGPPYVKCPLRALKMKAVRMFLKKLGLGRNVMVTGERAFESPSRYEKLTKRIENPIQFLTDLEAFHIAKAHNLLSKVYLINPRASCIPCPRASTLTWFLGYENLMLFDYEGFELLDKALEIDYERKRKHLEGITKEQFKWLGLHRIRPDLVKEEVRKLEALAERGKRSSKNEVYRIFREFYNWV